MAGPGTTFFSQKRDQNQELAQQAQVAAAKVAAANQALTLLGKATLTSAEAETLVQLYQEVQ